MGHALKASIIVEFSALKMIVFQFRNASSFSYSLSSLISLGRRHRFRYNAEI